MNRGELFLSDSSSHFAALVIIQILELQESRSTPPSPPPPLAQEEDYFRIPAWALTPYKPSKKALYRMDDGDYWAEKPILAE